MRGNAKQPTKDQRVVTETVTVGARMERTARQLDPSHYNCDDCGNQINPGDRAVALSMWRETTGHAQPAWESNFIEGINLKEPENGSGKRKPN